MNLSNQHQGVICAIIAYIIWGIAPSYFKVIGEIPTETIIVFRVIWSFIFLILLLSLMRGWSPVIQLVKEKKNILVLGLTSIIIGLNWLVFIWAINHEQMLEASLGYFINPLMNILFGFLFLRERFRPLQWVAITIAIISVGIQIWQFGHIPLVALSLAISFSLYSLIRKKIAVDAQAGLLIETSWLLPIALVYLFLTNQATYIDHLSTLSSNLILSASGAITTIPLLFFAAAATRLRLSTLGFFQYIGPTIIFIMAVIVYKEPFGTEKLATFGFIWLALAIFIVDSLLHMRGKQ